MAADNKQVDSGKPDLQESEESFACVNESQEKDTSGKTLYVRKLHLLYFLMLLIASPVIALLVSSGFIDRTPEPETVIEQPVSMVDVQEAKSDLKKVINSLNEINRNPDLKDDHVDDKKIESKAAVIPAAPVVVKEDKKITEAPKVKESKKPVLVAKTAVVAPVEPIAKVEYVPAEQDVVTAAPVYTKLDNKGNLLEDDTEQWACVYDTATGLIWEVKSEDDALRKSSNLYSWYNPDRKSLQGKADGGRCNGEVDCDTFSYIQAMNERNYCGHNDWKLPTREEMQTLVNMENNTVTIDKQYFPQTLPSWYWTSTENDNREELAWYVLFRNGLALNDLKERPKHIRLVRATVINRLGE